MTSLTEVSAASTGQRPLKKQGLLETNAAIFSKDPKLVTNTGILLIHKRLSGFTLYNEVNHSADENGMLALCKFWGIQGWYTAIQPTHLLSIAKGFCNFNYSLFVDFTCFLPLSGARHAAKAFHHTCDTDQVISLPAGVPSRIDDNLEHFARLLRVACYTLDALFIWKDSIRNAVHSVLTKWIDFLSIHYPGPLNPATLELFDLVAKTLLADLDDIYISCYSNVATEPIVLEVLATLPNLENVWFKRELLRITNLSFTDARLQKDSSQAERGARRTKKSSTVVTPRPTPPTQSSYKTNSTCFFNLTPNGCQFGPDKCHRTHRAAILDSEADTFLEFQKKASTNKSSPKPLVTSSKKSSS
jgi:hypothetical protein